MVFVPVHPDEQQFVDTALELVMEAGRLVRDAFDQPVCVVKTKESATDLVTETDQAVEKLLIKGLSEAFPDHKFIGEESTAGGASYRYTDAPTWIIDPIDGTTNFVHRIPLIAICVGLAINKELRAGIVYNPITKELFFAQVGRGAFKNGFPIRTSDTTAISNSVVITQLGSHRYPEMLHSYTASYKALMVDHNCHGHRCFGSAAINMIMVAQGACDAMVEYGLHSWDIAAAAVIVSEAGGFLIDPTGQPFNVMSRKVLCASTKELAMSLSAILAHADFEPECEIE
ncbi:hypothetical protein Q1695_008362 [Nippostrongylus brasiliensis]|nr:hypothetical protein Q1695_008362 [Nippostrongylus brasiliensis]